MTKRRVLLVKTEKLLETLLTEAARQQPAVFDADGVETVPAKHAVTFGERLRLAEVVTSYEVRRAKIEEDTETSELETIMEEFHVNRKASGGPGRKARPTESDGIANAGRELGPYRANGNA